LKIPALKFSRRWAFACLPLALIALVCSLPVPQRDPACAADVKAASERQYTDLMEANEARSFSTSIAIDELPGEDTSTQESTEETPAIQGSWARELRQLRELALQDSEAALARVSQMSVAEEREAALKEVCLQLAASDPASAMNAAWRFQLGRLGGLAESATLEDLARRWAAADLPAALAWVSQQPLDEAGQRDRVIKGIAAAWSEGSPADAAHLIAEYMSPNFAQWDAAMKLVGCWASADFAGAAAWVDLFPEGSTQDRAREELSKVVSTQQP
jgi:hypothetical protein